MGKGKTEKRRESGRKKADGLPLLLFLECFPVSPFPLFPSYTDLRFVNRLLIRSGPRGVLFGQDRQGTTFAKGLPSSLAANNLTGGIGHVPCTFQGPPKETDFRRPTKVCHKRSIPAGLGGLIAGFLHSTVTRRHEAGCFAAVTGEEEAGLANSALRGAERDLPMSGRPSPGAKTAPQQRAPGRLAFIREHSRTAGLISTEFCGCGWRWRPASAGFCR